MNQITPHLLWVGHAGDGRDFRQILDVGIQAIVQLAVEEPALQPPREIIYYRFPLVDGDGNRKEIVQLTLRSVVGLLETRTPVLLCCGAGMSRAPAIAAAALSLFVGPSAERCLEMVVRQHSRDVAPGFWAEILQFRPFDMMERRFTDRSRRVMQLARDQARTCHRKHLATTDILIGLVKEGDGLAAHAIKYSGLDLNRITQGVADVWKHFPSAGEVTESAGNPLARKVIDYAYEECEKLRHNYVGTEHLLLGLIRVRAGMGAQVLTNLGVNLEDVGNVVLDILGHPSRR